MAENTKIDTTFGLAAIIVLVVILLVLSGVNLKLAGDNREYEATMSGLVQSKNNKIKQLANQLSAKQQEVEALQNTLNNTKRDLDGLSRKIEEAPAAIAPSVEAIVDEVVDTVVDTVVAPVVNQN